jgi:hypothetical protein
MNEESRLAGEFFLFKNSSKSVNFRDPKNLQESLQKSLINSNDYDKNSTRVNKHFSTKFLAASQSGDLSLTFDWRLFQLQND